MRLQALRGSPDPRGKKRLLEGGVRVKRLVCDGQEEKDTLTSWSGGWHCVQQVSPCSPTSVAAVWRAARVKPTTFSVSAMFDGQLGRDGVVLVLEQPSRPVYQ